MKIYVDELPKCCFECPLRDYECDSYWCSVYEGSNVLFADEVKELNLCPLQSLADHDKQVRNEVCEDLYNKCVEKIWTNDEGFDCVDMDNIKEILDQIQGE